MAQLNKRALTGIPARERAALIQTLRRIQRNLVPAPQPPHRPADDRGAPRRGDP